MFVSRSSVAISAQSTDVNACGDFIKFLLSEDIQTGMAMNDSFVLNRKAFRRAGEAANEYYNNGGNHSGSTHALLSDGEKLTDEDLNAIENVISSCSGMYTENTAISIILIEEMPAYFLDQKDLNAVILIIQDRAQKVFDERG